MSLSLSRATHIGVTDAGDGTVPVRLEFTAHRSATHPPLIYDSARPLSVYPTRFFPCESYLSPDACVLSPTANASPSATVSLYSAPSAVPLSLSSSSRMSAPNLITSPPPQSLLLPNAAAFTVTSPLFATTAFISTPASLPPGHLVAPSGGSNVMSGSPSAPATIVIRSRAHVATLPSLPNVLPTASLRSRWQSFRASVTSLVDTDRVFQWGSRHGPRHRYFQALATGEPTSGGSGALVRRLHALPTPVLTQPPPRDEVLAAALPFSVKDYPSLPPGEGMYDERSFNNGNFLMGTSAGSGLMLDTDPNNQDAVSFPGEATAAAKLSPHIGYASPLDPVTYGPPLPPSAPASPIRTASGFAAAAAASTATRRPFPWSSDVPERPWIKELAVGFTLDQAKAYAEGEVFGSMHAAPGVDNPFISPVSVPNRTPIPPRGSGDSVWLRPGVVTPPPSPPLEGGVGGAVMAALRDRAQGGAYSVGDGSSGEGLVGLCTPDPVSDETAAALAAGGPGAGAGWRGPPASVPRDIRALARPRLQSDDLYRDYYASGSGGQRGQALEGYLQAAAEDAVAAALAQRERVRISRLSARALSAAPLLESPPPSVGGADDALDSPEWLRRSTAFFFENHPFVRSLPPPPPPSLWQRACACACAALDSVLPYGDDAAGRPPAWEWGVEALAMAARHSAPPSASLTGSRAAAATSAAAGARITTMHRRAHAEVTVGATALTARPARAASAAPAAGTVGVAGAWAVEVAPGVLVGGRGVWAPGAAAAVEVQAVRAVVLPLHEEDVDIAGQREEPSFAKGGYPVALVAGSLSSRGTASIAVAAGPFDTAPGVRVTATAETGLWKGAPTTLSYGISYDFDAKEAVASVL